MNATSPNRPPSPPRRTAWAGTLARAALARLPRRPGIVPLLVVLLVAACTDRTGPSHPVLGAAPEVLFRTLDGQRLTLGAARGPTLVSFWASDCAICLEEMPAMAALHADYAPRGFELIAVAMPHDRPDRVLELAEARELPFAVAIDIDGRVLAAFEPVAGTPTSFLADADGRIVERHVGRHDMEALRASLEALLAAREGRAAAAPAPRT